MFSEYKRFQDEKDFWNISGFDHARPCIHVDPFLEFFQLILGCAVNCDHKQEYIENIMSMDASSQQLIMQAIQEILNLPVRPLTFWYHREIRLECRCLQKCFLI